MTTPDLIAAIMTLTKQTCGGLLDHTPAQPKISADYAAQVPLPFAVFVEGDEKETFQSAGDGDARPSAIVHGQFHFTVFAASKPQARSIAEVIEGALEDAPLTFETGRLLELCPQSHASPPMGETGPGTPSIFQRAVLFQYAYQRY